ncbi:MAG: class I SAM-dependent methyltransferase [Terricaulis sp.]
MQRAASPATDIVELYQRHADAWAKARGPGVLFERPWLDRFCALIPAGGSILDIGCGAGQPIADFLIAQAYVLTGVDSSAPLLAFAHKRHPQREWIEADMRTLALGRRFDGLLLWDSFFHLTPGDQTAMFPVLRAHAAPGAALMFTSGPEHGVTMSEFQGDPLYHGSLAPEEYRALFEQNGIEEVAHVANDPTCGHHTIWLCRFRA